MAPVVFLMGVGPLARWKQAVAARTGACACAGPPAVAVVAALASGWLAGRITLVATIGLLMALLDRGQRRHRPVGAASRPRDGARHRGRALRQLPRAVVGMMVAHLGIAVFIFGVTMVKSYEVERDVKMARRRHRPTIDGYVFTFRGVREIDGPELPRRAGPGRGHARRHARCADMLPEKRVYRVQQQADDRGRHRHRPRRATSTSRSASRSTAAPGSCASTSSPSSTGSGAAAC